MRTFDITIFDLPFAQAKKSRHCTNKQVHLLFTGFALAADPSWSSVSGLRCSELGVRALEILELWELDLRGLEAHGSVLKAGWRFGRLEVTGGSA